MSNSESLPLCDIVVSNACVISTSRCFAGKVSDHSHCLDSNDTLECQICLIGKCAGKVVSRDLVGGNEGFLDQVLSPLIENGIMLA